MPRAEEVLFRPRGGVGGVLWVWPTPGVLAGFRFHASNEIDFDVDVRHPMGQGRLDEFCGFLRVIGRRLGKPVLVDPEGDYGNPVLGFDPGIDRVVALVAPWVE